MSGLAQLWDATRLRLLVELNRRGSLSAAAEAVHISQPTASQHLRLLETAAGQPLVERGGRQLRLTEAGRALAARAAHALATLQDAEDELASLAGLHSGTIHIGASTTPGAYVLPDTLACFARNHPAVAVELDVASSAEILDRLVGGRIQLAILSAEAAEGRRVDAQPFLEDELVGIARPAALPLRDGRVAATALSEQRLLARERGSGTQHHVDRRLADLGVACAARWELGSTEAIKRAAREGLGVAFVSRYAVAEELARGELEGFELADAPPLRRPLAIARLAGRPSPPAELRFVETLTSCCARSHPYACIS